MKMPVGLKTPLHILSYKKLKTVLNVDNANKSDKIFFAHSYARKYLHDNS
jgi:hypothetical protein